MSLVLITGAALLGLAGSAHCAAMCGASSTVVVRACSTGAGGRTLPAACAFQAGRLVGYALGGALVASSVSALAWIGHATPALRPLWALLHVAGLSLGVWLLFSGRQPRWLAQLGQAPKAVHAARADGWQVIAGPLKAGAAGSLWVAWPCGLLQSALVLAALADGPLAGAGVMATFGLASSIALWGAPLLWARFDRRALAWSIRLAGLCLVIGSGWSLGHGLWPDSPLFCTT
jgi:sulfite exporter TauE/SafE